MFMTRTLMLGLTYSSWLRKKISSLKTDWSQAFSRASRAAMRLISDTVRSLAWR